MMMERRLKPSLDELLGLLLMDGEWHTLDEIATELGAPEEKLHPALRFLSGYSIIELNQQGRKARLTAESYTWLKTLQERRP